MSDDLSQELAGVRAEIDGIDSELLTLLNRRAHCAQKVGEIKARHGEAGHIYRPEREAQVLRRLQGENVGPFDDEQITWFFREIMSACLSLEKPLEVAYLGPEGSFTGSAAAKHFGHAARLVSQCSIDDVFREVESGHADYAVVPVENSTEGAVGRTLDLLFATPLTTCGEVVVRIHQNLMTRCAGLTGVSKVYSHAQSLAQCHEWLNRNLPGVPRVPMASNSLAAQTAAAEEGAAAIAGEAAAERYGLPILARSIEDEPNNTTRFLVLGRHDAAPSGRDKTSLIMSATNRTGALHDLLVPFASSGVSLTRLESRPARQALWQYVFYVDIDGHRDEARVKSALDELGARAAFLKVLGSYPVAVY
ncbi:MAG: prephenate dehydratase [Azonexus sp.]|nr:prephenate dehydratase [Betaproteobacteria bacterium]MBP6035463.1 prephenate dehydratase [Azonexus sp.]MBP6906413.1 prephenate dehydratase [Azonexus sp.]